MVLPTQHSCGTGGYSSLRTMPEPHSPTWSHSETPFQNLQCLLHPKPMSAFLFSELDSIYSNKEGEVTRQEAAVNKGTSGCTIDTTGEAKTITPARSVRKQQGPN